MIVDWIRKHPKASICTDEGLLNFKDIANFQDYHGLPEFRNVLYIKPHTYTNTSRVIQEFFEADELRYCFSFSCLGDCKFYGEGEGWEGEIRPESDRNGRRCYWGERNRHLLFSGSGRCLFDSFSILCSVSSPSSSSSSSFCFSLNFFTIVRIGLFIYLFFLEKKDLSFSFFHGERRRERKLLRVNIPYVPSRKRRERENPFDKINYCTKILYESFEILIRSNLQPSSSKK